MSFRDLCESSGLLSFLYSPSCVQAPRRLMIFLCFPIIFIISISDTRSDRSFSVASSAQDTGAVHIFYRASLRLTSCYKVCASKCRICDLFPAIHCALDKVMCYALMKNLCLFDGLTASSVIR